MKTADELAEEYAQKINSDCDGTTYLVTKAFKAGHASRDEEGAREGHPTNTEQDLKAADKYAMRVVCVVAGNAREFHEFIKKACRDASRFVVEPGGTRAMIDGVNFRYVSDAHSIRGLNGAEVRYYGSYLHRKDLDQIEDVIRSGVFS